MNIMAVVNLFLKQQKLCISLGLENLVLIINSIWRRRKGFEPQIWLVIKLCVSYEGFSKETEFPAIAEETYGSKENAPSFD